MDKNNWSCLPMAFAKALSIPFEKMIQMIGHDGSEQVYKNKKYRRGFHIQECIDVAFKLGYSCTPIEFYYGLTPDGLETYIVGTKEFRLKRFDYYLTYTDIGVLEGTSLDKDNQIIGHAATWLDGKIIDPKGKIYTFPDRIANGFSITKLWRIE